MTTRSASASSSGTTLSPVSQRHSRSESSGRDLLLGAALRAAAALRRRTHARPARPAQRPPCRCRSLRRSPLWSRHRPAASDRPRPSAAVPRASPGPRGASRHGVELVGHQASVVVMSNAGGWCRCFLTEQRLMELMTADLYFSGKPAGSFKSMSTLLMSPGAVELWGHRDARALRVDAALLHEAEREDTGAGADRGEEEVERRRRGVVAAAARRLIGLNREPTVVRVHALAARKVHLHVHARVLSLARTHRASVVFSLGCHVAKFRNSAIISP